MVSIRVKLFALNLANKMGYSVEKLSPLPKNYENIIKFVRPYTVTPMYAIAGLLDSVNYIIKNKIEGDIVECGVWRGGSIMAIAKMLVGLKNNSKEIYLLDTFEGMAKPSEVDIDIRGNSMLEQFEKMKITEDSSNWMRTSLLEVKKAVYSTGYDKEKFHFIKGKVEDTLPKNAPEKISLLRLDTDWYKSTKHEMINLFPRLSKDGIIIIDDYGSHLGSKKAVDEYLSENNILLFLSRLGAAGPRVGVKT